MKNLFLTILFLVPVAALAEPTDKANQQALEQTQQLLKDKDLRNKAIEGSDSAKAADSYVKKSSSDPDGVYSLSAEIMADLVKQTDGDPAKLQKLIDEARRNPSAFGENLSTEQKEKLKKLAQPRQAESP